MRASPPRAMHADCERASLLVAGNGDDDVGVRVSTSPGDGYVGRTRAQRAVAVVVAILGTSAVVSTKSHWSAFPGLGLRNAVHRVDDTTPELEVKTIHVETTRPTAWLGAQPSGDEGEGEVVIDGIDSDVPTSTSAMRTAAIETGFAIPVSDAELQKHHWLVTYPPGIDLFLENIFVSGADSLPDVVPGVPFDGNDSEYETDGWAHKPFSNTLIENDRTIGNEWETSFDLGQSSNPNRETSSDLGQSSSSSTDGRKKNSFVACVDHSSDWDVAFPEGWFQGFVDQTMTAGYCLSDIIYDATGDWETSGCKNADVVLFNEGALIWKGAHRVVGPDNSERYELPQKTHPDQVFVYFAHEAPAGFGGELLDRRLMDQFDYLASANEKGSSAWWNFAFSARHLTQDFAAFSRPFEERSPALAWLAIDCGGHPREGMLLEISTHYPVWSLGACRNNKRASDDMPGRDTVSDQQRRRMQLALSQHLFYFSAENSDCPGYTTEKLWMALSRGSIPVYYGNAEVKKSLPCSECVLDVRDFESAQALATRMKEIASSKEEYQRLTNWRFQEPKTWPAEFRKAVAVASADVTRVTCGLLRGKGDAVGESGTREKAKPALAQVSKNGGWAPDSDGSNLGSDNTREASYHVGKDAPAWVKQARDAFEQGNGNSPELVTKLKLAHCGGDEEDVNDDSFSGALGLISSSTQSRGGVFGKRVSEFANPQHEFTDPESHYDKLCQDEGKMACFALRG